MRLEPQAPHILGYALVAFGAAVAAFFWFIMGNVPLTALGIGMAVVGSSLAITPLSPVPSATVRRLLEGSLLNIEALLEELGASGSGKGYYVPRRDGGVQVFIPMTADGTGAPPPADAAADGLVAKVGGKQYLVVYPPAASLMANREPEGDGSDLEGAISEALVEEAGLADSLRVAESGQAVTVEISSPKSKAGAGRVRHSMGSLEAGIAAAVAAGAKGKPVTVESEEDAANGRKRTVTLAVHGA